MDRGCFYRRYLGSILLPEIGMDRKKVAPEESILARSIKESVACRIRQVDAPCSSMHFQPELLLVSG